MGKELKTPLDSKGRGMRAFAFDLGPPNAKLQHFW
jgi:hypothetical protein